MFTSLMARYSVLALEIPRVSLPDLPSASDLSSLQTMTGLLAVVYIAILTGYLLIMPAFTYFYLKNRWYVAGSIERLIMYFFVFLFFPGLLLLSPFLNFRPRRRQVQS